MYILAECTLSPNAQSDSLVYSASVTLVRDRCCNGRPSHALKAFMSILDFVLEHL
jgi:hypothetical protein